MFRKISNQKKVYITITDDYVMSRQNKINYIVIKDLHFISSVLCTVNQLKVHVW